ncbi:MAG: hypothetical protein MESAZ_02043 [Saezia sanguinis]
MLKQRVYAIAGAAENCSGVRRARAYGFRLFANCEKTGKLGKSVQ